MEVTRDGGQRGQIHVDGKRAERRQRAQHDDEFHAAQGRERCDTISLQSGQRHP
jgi:hypothetical protein